jgi:hypothetical protein
MGALTHGQQTNEDVSTAVTYYQMMTGKNIGGTTALMKDSGQSS